MSTAKNISEALQNLAKYAMVLEEERRKELAALRKHITYIETANVNVRKYLATLKQESTELKERLAAAESLLSYHYDIGPESSTEVELFFGRELSDLDLEALERNAPTDPYLAKLWARYQKLQKFK